MARDHVFLVIGRKAGSSLSDPKTWGDAYICDPLSNKAYPASEYESYLVTYAKSSFSQYYYRMVPFDPKKHQLIVCPIRNATGNKIREEVNNTALTYSKKIEVCLKLLQKIAKKGFGYQKKHPIGNNNDVIALTKGIAELKKLVKCFSHTRGFSGFELMDELKDFYCLFAQQILYCSFFAKIVHLGEIEYRSKRNINQPMPPYYNEDIVELFPIVGELHQYFAYSDHDCPSDQQIIDSFKPEPMANSLQRLGLERSLEIDPSCIVTILLTHPQDERFDFLMANIELLESVCRKKFGQSDYHYNISLLLCHIISTLPKVEQIELFIKKLIADNIIAYHKDHPKLSSAENNGCPVLIGREFIMAECRQKKEELETLLSSLEKQKEKPKSVEDNTAFTLWSEQDREKKGKEQTEESYGAYSCTTTANNLVPVGVPT
jgi:hypothetical protein